MKKIIVATGNEGKMDEIRQILQGENIQFVSLKDENLQDVEIIENGSTFEENAIIKARTISDLTGQMYWQMICMESREYILHVI